VERPVSFGFLQRKLLFYNLVPRAFLPISKGKALGTRLIVLFICASDFLLSREKER